MLPPDLTKAINDLMRSDLEGWSNSCFTFLKLSTYLVIAGIVLEGPEMWQAGVHLFGYWRRTIGHWWNTNIKRTDLCGWDRLCPELNTLVSSDQSRTRSLVVFAGLIGWVFVIAGVAGEGIGESVLADADTNLRTFNDIILAETTKDAGNAKASAEAASAIARKATASARLANREAREASASANTARREAADARQQTLATEAKLNEEHNKRLELEKTIAPRLITVITLPPQHISTIDALRQFAGMSVIIECIPDWEARRAAGSLAHALSAAGLLIEKTSVVDKKLADGVEVYAYYPPADAWDKKKVEEYARNGFPDWNKSSDTADGVIAFLQANDWQAESGYDINTERALRMDEILVRVGFKPAPYFAVQEPSPKWNPLGKKVEEIRNQVKKVLLESQRVMEETTRPKKPSN